MTKPNAATMIAQAALRGLLTLADRAAPTCRFQQSRVRLGQRFDEVAIEAIRRNTAKTLADDFCIDAVLHAPKGLPVAEMVMAQIIADATKDIIAAAQADDGSTTNER